MLAKGGWVLKEPSWYIPSVPSREMHMHRRAGRNEKRQKRRKKWRIGASIEKRGASQKTEHRASSDERAAENGGQNGESGLRSPYLPYAKRAIYQLI